MQKSKIVCIVGTRPDSIKSAPVVLELKRYSNLVDTLLVSTGQHKEILEQSLNVFNIQCDYNLDIMEREQSLAKITTKALEGLDNFLAESQPDFVICQGDTTTTFAAALACFYRQIPFGHIEAGLRTETIDRPFPEEYNRRSTSLIATQHYAPTLLAANNLTKQYIDTQSIFITGNTGIDAVKSIASYMSQHWYLDRKDQRILLLTTHRRENWGEPQMQIAKAMLRLVNRFEDTFLVVAMHPNPQVRDILQPILGNHSRVELIEAPSYPSFVKLMQRSYLIFTDSGGIQEEAPTFGIPILVLRECTERPEGIQAGNAMLVGTSEERIFEEGASLLEDPAAYQSMARALSPYGDGHAAKRIRYLILKHLGIISPKEIMWISSKQSF